MPAFPFKPPKEASVRFPPSPTDDAETYAHQQNPPARVQLKRRSVMWHEQSPRAQGSFCKCLRALTAAAFGLTRSGAVVAARDHVPSLRRTSDRALFQVHISSDILPIPIRRIHTWTVQVSDQDRRSVEGASIEIAGGRAVHHHGLTTRPRVAATGSPGVYKITGVRFPMTGRWILNLAIQTPDGRSDTVTFKVIL